MNNKHLDLFDILVKAYYEDHFDETLNRIITCHEVSPQETFNIITSLCGVELDFDNNYVENIKRAITNYSVHKRIVEKLDCCNSDCKPNDNKEFNCQKACPFHAIYFDQKENTTVIDENLCINCGVCIDACKHGRILDKIEYIPIMNLIKEHKTVIALVSPAIVGQFGENTTMDQLRSAFIKLGFSEMIETAFACDILSIKETEDFNKHVNEPTDFMLNSGYCPIWISMINNLHKDLVPSLSPEVSPMIVAGRIIKKLHKDAKVVYISPCVAKKTEANKEEFKGIIDFVITFQELKEIFNAFHINVASLKGIPTIEYASKGGRLYGISGGVSIAVTDILQELYPEKIHLFKSTTADGIDDCKKIINAVLNGENVGSFVEGAACMGGCVGGPKKILPPNTGAHCVKSLADDSLIKSPIYSKSLDKILNSLNINSIEDFKDDNKISFLKK